MEESVEPPPLPAEDEGWGPVVVDESGQLVEVDPPKQDGRKGNSGSFKKGDPRRFNNTGNPAGAGRKKRVPVEGVGVLRSMRHVLQNNSTHDALPLDRVARRWHDDDPGKFLAKFEALEAAELEKVEKKIEAEESVVDLGHDAACKVLDRLLKEAAK
jgi:hypothetical protein